MAEFVMAGEILRGILDLVRSKLKELGKAREAVGNLVIGTVEEDICNIGKNIAITLTEAAGSASAFTPLYMSLTSLAILAEKRGRALALLGGPLTPNKCFPSIRWLYATLGKYKLLCILASMPSIASILPITL